MVRAVFKRPVRIGSAEFKAGQASELDPALLSHWFIAALKKDGLVDIITEDAPAVETKPTHVTTEPVAHKVETGAPAVEKKPAAVAHKRTTKAAAKK